MNLLSLSYFSICFQFSSTVTVKYYSFDFRHSHYEGPICCSGFCIFALYVSGIHCPSFRETCCLCVKGWSMKGVILFRLYKQRVPQSHRKMRMGCCPVWSISASKFSWQKNIFPVQLPKCSSYHPHHRPFFLLQFTNPCFPPFPLLTPSTLIWMGFQPLYHLLLHLQHG